MVSEAIEEEVGKKGIKREKNCHTASTWDEGERVLGPGLRIKIMGIYVPHAAHSLGTKVA